VPAGRYFLEVDTADPKAGDTTQLIELTTSTPDLSIVVAGRPDLRLAASPTSVTLSVANVSPWVPSGGGFGGDVILIAGSQAHVYSRPVIGGGAPPYAGATTYLNTFDWNLGSTALFAGLPDASKGDVEYVYQRSTRPIGGGTTQGAVHAASRFQRIDSLTLRDGTSARLDATLGDAPQTGSLRVDLRNAEFAALGPEVNPQARPNFIAGGVSVLAIPHTLDFPDQPSSYATSSVLWVQGPSATDVDYGTVSYGRFLEPFWQEARYVLYFFDMDLTFPGRVPYPWYSNGLVSLVPATSSTPIAPAISPPRAPRIEGRDAFAPQTGVGLEPTLSWSPPRFGNATSYLVTITPVFVNGVRPPGIQSLSLSVYTGTSVRIPAGFLAAGVMYVASIAAISAPWDALDRPPFRMGMPLHQADCVTGIFAP
jgi:hypothetical protein